MKLIFIYSLVMISVAYTQVTIPPVFSNSMVLQCEKPVPVWGTAAANEQVTVEFAGQKKMVTAGADGTWMLTLDPLFASAEPRTMTISSSESKTSQAFTDVLIGEVWLCSGQSNMYMPMEPITWAPDGVENSKQEIAKADFPEIRLFCDPQHPAWNKRGWQKSSPEAAASFSAVAYYFGRELYQQLHIPVGLINISRGGSPIQQWIPSESARQVPIIQKYSEVFENNKQRIMEYNRELAAYYNAVEKKDPNRSAASVKLPQPLPEPLETARAYTGSSLYENLIEPIIPYAIRGVLWYQGEANSKNLDIAQHYDEMLQALITALRQKWNNPKLPFFFVQLPAWNVLPNAEFWPWTRQGMLKVSQSMSDVGMAVTVDVGDLRDLHPPRKKPVGERLALLALAKTYGKSGVYSGPIPIEIKSESNELRVCFDTFGSDLQIKGNKWADVEIAGADGLFYPADATINKSDATVSCPQVKKPTALRYGWKPYFEPSLFNKEGLPGTPFYFVCGKDGKWHLWSSRDLSSSCNLMFTQGDSWCGIGDKSVPHTVHIRKVRNEGI